ncbi:MAG: VOC family protein [Paracoccus sp. (in: a-proteobacteria)]|jgi:hypothetical protein|uniref:VOC family protein n=1 Tax=unclassified Paracoccus (in: a-proteobacteria) TaxID=2688777 RepID=UPI000C43913F|nr:MULTISPECIES: VOC family protein [unclassified Paracoccus (in: a-proteobacteria)]MAN56462.1 glyoxalase/bleomycin resistance/extradiol dioxygenase family protein [Paracoccus sp. (in: a-proteobacteria)]MBA50316.1 glyoxalase/bleomycin resistance/extradiol dioxygenase family protein [Paracoccus sp. (in: a-proteobacteria)]|tara:strand:+ start:16822 stop:17613 length:792 start_codon:yes stop_codon:yes gene_type:complete
MAGFHGKPCWYELTTSKGNLAAAGDFYGAVLGWSIRDAGMDDFSYHLASAGDDRVAGLMEMPPDVSQMPPNWLIYFAVEDADGAAADIIAAGGRIFREPADIPGTGRFAIASDPQGAAFGILQPLPMEDGAQGGQAFDQSKAGHGNWNELMSTDPKAGFAFYSALLGWSKSRPIDMGEMGTYQLFSHDGTDIGGMMGMGNAPVPAWLPYFGTDGVTQAMVRIEAGGGAVIHGPQEVPGGAFIAIARDPQGAHFAVVGPRQAAP